MMNGLHNSSYMTKKGAGDVKYFLPKNVTYAAVHDLECWAEKNQL